MRFSQEICARLLQSSESSFRAEAISKKPQCLAGFWKKVRVLCHVDLSTVLPVYTWQLVFLRVRKQEGCHNAFFDLASEVTRYHTAIFLCLVRESQGEELSSISCKQFMDKAHVTGSHKRILNIPSYLRFTNSIHKSVNRGQTLKVSCTWVIPSLKWPHWGSCNWYICQEEGFSNGFLETPPSDNGVWLKLLLWCYGNTTYDFQKREWTQKKLKLETVLIILFFGGKNDWPIYSNPVLVCFFFFILGIVLFGLYIRKTSELSWLLDITKHYRAMSLWS